MTMWNDKFVEYTSGGGLMPELPTHRDDLLNLIADAEFHAEAQVARAANALIAETRKAESHSFADRVKFIRGMISMAEALGIKVKETPYDFDEDGDPICGGPTHSFSVSIGEEEDEETIGEPTTVTARITLIPETGEAYYRETFDGPTDVHDVDSGFVTMAEAPEMAANIVYHSIDIVAEQAVQQEIPYLDSDYEHNMAEAERARETIAGAIVSLRVGNRR